MKRQLLAVLMGPFAMPAISQVRTDAPVRFTGEQQLGAIVGLAAPMQGDAAITVNGALQTGSFSWCEQVVMSGDTVQVSAVPALGAYANGLLLRFAAPTAITGTKFIKAPGLAALPLVRTDGLPLTPGQLPAGYVIEAIHANGRFHVLNTMGSGCPPGFTQAHQNLCIETALTSGLLFRQGVDRCARLGGKLCAWDEFLAACTLLEGVLQNQFTDWEWIDDSSNHGHGADQVGRFTCLSQRHYGQLPTFPAGTRCCYRPR